MFSKLQCDTIYVTEYETKYEEKCHTSYEEKCHEVGYGYHKDYKCEQIPKKHCDSHPVQASFHYSTDYGHMMERIQTQSTQQATAD